MRSFFSTLIIIFLFSSHTNADCLTAVESLTIECKIIQKFDSDEVVQCPIVNLEEVMERSCFRDDEKSFAHYHRLFLKHLTVKGLFRMIPETFAEQYPNLISLTIDNAGLDLVARLDQFKYLQKFVSIDNPLNVITKETFASNPFLDHVELIDNKIFYVEEGSFGDIQTVVMTGQCKTEDRSQCNERALLSRTLELYARVEGAEKEARKWKDKFVNATRESCSAW